MTWHFSIRRVCLWFKPQRTGKNGEDCLRRNDVETWLYGLDKMGPFQYQHPDLELISISCFLKIDSSTKSAFYLSSLVWKIIWLVPNVNCAFWERATLGLHHPLPLFTAETLGEPQRHAHSWVTTQWWRSYVHPFVLPRVSSEICYRPLGLETAYEIHSVLFGATHFPAAHQGTVILAIWNVGWLQTNSPFKPSFLLFTALVLVYSRCSFLSPDVLCVSEMRVAALKKNQTFFPVACEGTAAEHWPGSCNFIVLLI